jgi:flagellar L-ring protein precursor FlgH
MGKPTNGAMAKTTNGAMRKTTNGAMSDQKMLVWASLALAACLVICGLSGCVTHIAPYRPKHRRFDPGDYGKAPRPANGSLYAAGQRGFYEDDRASRVGDILIVRIDESENASRDASSKLSKKGSQKYGVPASFGILDAVKAKYPNVDPEALFGAESDSEFDGKGQVKRAGKLTATLSVRIRKVMPNGDFYIEGTKVIMVGNEEHHLYVSGLVRAADVRADDTVLSSRIADAEIEYTGRGDVSDQQRPGWLARALSAIWPF